MIVWNSYTLQSLTLFQASAYQKASTAIAELAEGTASAGLASLAAITYAEAVSRFTELLARPSDSGVAADISHESAAENAVTTSLTLTAPNSASAAAMESRPWFVVADDAEVVYTQSARLGTPVRQLGNALVTLLEKLDSLDPISKSLIEKIAYPYENPALLGTRYPEHPLNFKSVPVDAGVIGTIYHGSHVIDVISMNAILRNNSLMELMRERGIDPYAVYQINIRRHYTEFVYDSGVNPEGL